MTPTEAFIACARVGARCLREGLDLITGRCGRWRRRVTRGHLRGGCLRRMGRVVIHWGGGLCSGPCWIIIELWQVRMHFICRADARVYWRHCLERDGF